jgi:hypothetical protein
MVVADVEPVAKSVTIQIKGGDRLRRYMRDTARRMGSGAVLNVGILASAKYPNGLHVAQNAFWQEFGTKNMPARPFLRRTIDAHSGKWGENLGRIAVAQHYDVRRTLTLMGEGIKGQIVQTIVELTDPPLAPSTVAQKGFDKPLIETGLLQRSVDYEITNL